MLYRLCNVEEKYQRIQPERKAGLVTGFLANKCPLWVLASTHIEVEVSDVFFVSLDKFLPVHIYDLFTQRKTHLTTRTKSNTTLCAPAFSF